MTSMRKPKMREKRTILMLKLDIQNTGTKCKNTWRISFQIILKLAEQMANSLIYFDRKVLHSVSKKKVAKGKVRDSPMGKSEASTMADKFLEWRRRPERKTVNWEIVDGSSIL